MLEVWRRMVIGSAIAMYLAGLACAAGVLLKGMRVDERLSGALATSVDMAPAWRWAALDGASTVVGREVGR